MREIKFRGWHTKAFKMFSAEEMLTDQLTITTTGNFINVSDLHTRLSEIYPNDKFIPMQYTGLKDKNDKEIYEGDIVTYMFSTNGEIWQNRLTSVVEFKNGSFKPIPVNFECEDSYYSEIYYDYEVIGNIYENPELFW